MKLIECPRDAWQGLPDFIPTEKKAAYLNQLLKVGFDTIDFGSFVSAAAMPQVRDTGALLDLLDLSETNTKLLAIVANERGAAEACGFDKVSYLGFPFSISETFQLRNTNSNIQTSLNRVQNIAELCDKTGKKLVVYISMGFGNPYGDPWSPELVTGWVAKLVQLDVTVISLADTVGVAATEDVTGLFTQLIPEFPAIEFGAHFHTRPESWQVKTEAAYDAGCRRFDGALLGFGGCPMAQDSLVGNMPTERLIEFAGSKGEPLTIDKAALMQASSLFLEITGK